MPTSDDVFARISQTQIFSISLIFGFFGRILFAVAYVALLGCSATSSSANANNASSHSLHY